MKTTRNWWQHNTMKHQTFLFITSQFMFCTCYISCSTLKYLRQTRSRLNLIEFWWDVKVSGFHCVGQWGSVLYFICCTADHVQRAKWRDTIILHYGKSRNQVFWKLTLTSDCPSPTVLPDKNKNILHFLGTSWTLWSDGVFKILFFYNICERQLQAPNLCWFCGQKQYEHPHLTWRSLSYSSCTYFEGD